MITAGSREGTCCNKGNISSVTIHLSKCDNNFPIQIKPLTLTDNRDVFRISRFILGSNAVLMALKSRSPEEKTVVFILISVILFLKYRYENSQKCAI